MHDDERDYSWEEVIERLRQNQQRYECLQERLAE